MWDFNSGKLKKKFKEHKKGVVCVKKFSKNNFASCSNDKTVRIWNLNNNQSMKTLKHTEGVVTVGFLDLKTMLSATHEIYLWDLETGKLINQIKRNKKNMDINRIEIKSNFEFITCSNDRTIKIWDTRSQDNCAKYSWAAHEKEIECIKLLPENKLASGGRDETFQIWDLRTYKRIHYIKENTCVWDLDLCDNGDIVSCTYEGSINLWRENQDTIKTYKTITNAHDAREPAINRIKMFSNETLVSCSNDNKIRYWDLKKWTSNNYIPKTFDKRHTTLDGIWCID